MPMLTTVRMRCPVAPVHDPSRTRSAKSPIAPSTSWTSGDDVVVCRRPRADRPRAGGPQGDVQHGAVLGDVDPLAGEHGAAPSATPAASATASRATSTASSMRCLE